MGGWVYLAASIAFYAAFPILMVALRPTDRLLYMYLYMALVHLFGGIVGSVYSITLTDGIALSAGSVAYGALVMTALLVVMVGHEVRVVRGVIVNVVLTNVFKVGAFALTGFALTRDGFTNRYSVPPELFGSSLWITLIGGTLIVVELFAYLIAYQLVRPRLQSTVALAMFHMLCYIGLLVADSVLFPSLLRLTGAPIDVLAMIQSGVAGKLILGIGFSIPLMLAVIVFRKRIPGLNELPLRVGDVFVAPRTELFDRISRSERELAASRVQLAEATGRLERTAAFRRAIAVVDQRAAVGDKLRALAEILARDGEFTLQGVTLVVYHDGTEVASYGPRGINNATTVAARTRLSGGGPWIESGEFGGIVCLPIWLRDELTGVLEIRLGTSEAARLLDHVRGMELEVGALFRDDIAHARAAWTRRKPILTILESGQANAAFQPIVNLKDKRIVEYEGLIRFESGISPLDRFREAENAGLGVELELLSLQTVIKAAESLPPGIPLAVNVSPRTVLDPRFRGVLGAIARPLTLEITEHHQIEDYSELAAVLRELPNIRLGVDDAGSGYSTLQHILRLRPAVVKLDMSWVQGVFKDKARQSLLRALVSFSMDVGATLTAEGIESPDDEATLVALGVTNGQGYLYGRPEPLPVQ